MTWTRQLITGLTAGLLALAAPGQITFQPPAAYSVGLAPDAVAAADFDGDGLADLAVSSDAPDKVSLLFNQGNGTFGAPVHIPVGSNTSPHTVRAGDLDLDGDADLAVTLKGTNQLLVLLNTGGGAFTSGGTVSTGGVEPRDLVLADLDGDGDLDAAASNRSSDNLAVLFNTAGSFGGLVLLAAGQEPRGVAAADLDGDGDQDLVAANHDSRDLSVHANMGAGAFSAPVFLSVGSDLRPEGLAAADLDGDGDPDLAAATSGNGFHGVSLFNNSGTGTFTGPVNAAVQGLDPSAVVAADLDADGDADLATANSDSGDVGLLENTGGAFTSAGVLAAGTGPGHLAAADLTGAGGMDLVTANDGSGDVTVFLNANQGPPPPPPSPSLTMLTPPLTGTTATMRISSPADAGRGYLCAFSGGTTFPIQLPDGRSVPLEADAVFALSMSFGNGFFLNTFGGLDAQGDADVFLVIPDLPALSGLNLFSAFVVADPSASLGIGTISPALQITLQ